MRGKVLGVVVSCICVAHAGESKGNLFAYQKELFNLLERARQESLKRRGGGSCYISDEMVKKLQKTADRMVANNNKLVCINNHAN